MPNPKEFSVMRDFNCGSSLISLVEVNGIEFSEKKSLSVFPLV